MSQRQRKIQQKTQKETRIVEKTTEKTSNMALQRKGERLICEATVHSESWFLLFGNIISMICVMLFIRKREIEQCFTFWKSLILNGVF